MWASQGDTAASRPELTVTRAALPATEGSQTEAVRESAGRRERAPLADGAVDDTTGAPTSPCDRAQHFVEHLPCLSVAEWADVLQRVHAVDASARATALHRVGELLDRHPDLDRIGGLQRAACAAAPRYTGAGRLATHAAFALALRDALSAHEFAALYGPFARPESATSGAAPRPTDRRVAVDALADVARPLADGDDGGGAWSGRDAFVAAP